jgi:hypothetical protein
MKNNSNTIAIAIALTALIAFGINSNSAHAVVSVDADVSDRIVPIGTTINYTITLTSSDEQPDLRQFTWKKQPRFDNLRPSPSASQNSQTSMIQGKVSFKIMLTWQLTPLAEGPASIQAAEADYKGEAYALPMINIKVVKTQAEALPPEVQSGDILPVLTGSADLDAQLKGRLFARLDVSKKDPYLQEPVTVSCTIYADDQVAQLIRDVKWDAPPWQDFFAEDIPLGQVHFQPTMVGQKKYQAVTIKKFMISPTRTGEITIPASQAACSIRVQRRISMEDDFFNFGPGFDPFDRGATAQLPMAEQKITAKPLPAEGKPAAFQNAVGHFAFAGSIDRQQLTEDDLLTLQLSVGGEGYLGSIAEPIIPDLPEWQRVGTQNRTESTGKTMKSLSGKKVFEYLLRPQKMGMLTVPAIQYAFFDPTTGQYVQSQAGPFTVQVSKGSDKKLIVADSGGMAASSSTARAPQFFGDQAAYIRTAYPASTASLPPYENPVFLWLQVLPLGALLLSLGYRSRQSYLLSHRDSLRYRAAGSKARRELKEAQAALRQGESLPFYARLAEALRVYLATKLNRSAAGLTLEEIEAACKNHGLSAEQSEAVRRLLERCDQARFITGGASDAETMQQTYAQAESLFQQLDKAFGK